MKYLITLFVLALFVNAAYCDDSAYIKRMKKNIESLDSAKALEEVQKIANSFERIANAEQDKWEPLYYNAYANLYSSFFTNENEKKDQFLTSAMNSIEKAEEITGENSEVYALKGYILMMQISVNPMQRGQKLGPKSAEFLQKSAKLDDTNPRPVIIRALNLYHTPPNWGGDKEKACGMFKEALQKIEDFEPESEISPQWGGSICTYMISECEKNTSD